MNNGDKITIVEGDYMGRFGNIEKKEGNNTYSVKLDDTEKVVIVQGYEIELYDEEL